MFRALWDRFIGRRGAAAEERALERQHMSPSERKFTDESVDDRQAEIESEAHFGGIDPNRLLDE